MFIFDMDNPKREAAFNARRSSNAQIQTDRGSRRSEVERRREQDRGAEHGITRGRHDEGGPQEREYCSGQHRDEVKRKSGSGHSVRVSFSSNLARHDSCN